MSDLFPPGTPVMFSAVRGDNIPVQQIGVVVAYPRKPHPTSWVLVQTRYATVEVKVDNLSAVEFLTLLPKSSCENDDHQFAGACTRECADLVDAMSGDGYTEPMEYGDYLGGVSSVDRSGCHSGPQTSYDAVHYDAANRAVVCLTLHDPGCPAWIDAAIRGAHTVTSASARAIGGHAQPVRTFYHSRKGRIRGVVVSVTGEWTHLVLVGDQTLRYYSKGADPNHEDGEPLTVRTSFLTEVTDD